MEKTRENIEDNLTPATKAKQGLGDSVQKRLKPVPGHRGQGIFQVESVHGHWGREVLALLSR